MKLLITDLDNTLYDWVGFYAHAFGAMVKQLSRSLQIPKERLLDEFKTIHQFYGNSEQPYAALELPSVQRRFPGMPRAEIAEQLVDALEVFDTAREKHLRLYDGVFDTLVRLTDDGVWIVGHTEASAANAYSRLHLLGISHFFRRLYTIADHKETYFRGERPPRSFIREVSPADRKPNPRLIKDICNAEKVDLDEVWYVGDSLIRDVAMAKAAGVTAVWAKYGTEYDKQLWNDLVRITHWTSADVAREEQLRRDAKNILPDYVIRTFGELPTLMAPHITNNAVSSVK